MSNATPPDTRSETGKYARRREEILLAAAAAFAEKGFHGCRTQDIADRLGLKQASLYYYFPSKEAALEAVCQHGIGVPTARLRQLLADAATPLPEKIHRIIRAHLQDLQTSRDCMIVLTEQRRHLPAAQQALLQEVSQAYQLLLLQLFEDARARAELRSGVDCQLAARALTDLCNGAALWLPSDHVHDLEHLAEQYTQMLCAGIYLPSSATHSAQKGGND